MTITGAVVNIFLILFKFLTGTLGHSQALITDAVHSISDLFTDGIVLLGIRFGQKGPDERHHFGHSRIETLSSALIGLALLVTAILLGVRSAINLYRQTGTQPTGLALIGAGISILFKEALYHYTVRIGRRIKSMAVIANAWHHRSDSLSSIAVFLGVGAAWIRPEWHFLDSVAAICVSLFIIKVAVDILLKTLREFTDTAPSPEILEKLNACALKVPGVIENHDIRVRTSGGLYQMEMHIMVDGSLTVREGHAIAKKVEACLIDEVEDIDTLIIHVDPAEKE